MLLVIRPGCYLSRCVPSRFVPRCGGWGGSKTSRCFDPRLLGAANWCRAQVRGSRCCGRFGGGRDDIAGRSFAWSSECLTHGFSLWPP